MVSVGEGRSRKMLGSFDAPISHPNVSKARAPCLSSKPISEGIVETRSEAS